MSATTSLMSKFSSAFSMFSGDVSFILTALFVLWAFTLYFGRGKIISFILSFYPATFLYNNFPFTTKILSESTGNTLLLKQLGIFLIFFIPLNIIINRYIFSESEYRASSNLLRSGGLAVSALILVMIFSYITVDLSSFHDFSPKIDDIFTSGDRIFYWNLASILILAIL